jgi:hypothetical protein
MLTKFPDKSRHPDIAQSIGHQSLYHGIWRLQREADSPLHLVTGFKMATQVSVSCTKRAHLQD